MSKIIKQDSNGVKPLLAVGEFGYDNYPEGGDIGRVYVGNGSENIKLAKKTEVDSHVTRVDNPHTVTKTQVGLSNVDNTADIDKNVASAAKWTTARTLSLTGDITGSVSIDGSGNASIVTTVAANSVALGTDTTGNYVAGNTAGTGIVVSGTAGEGWSPTIALSDVGTVGTYTKVTTNSKGQITVGDTLVAADIPNLDASKITAGTLPVLRGGTGVTTVTGTGSVVLNTSPALVTPDIGIATGTSFNSITGLASVNPIIAGVAAVGTSTQTARQDHVHPEQTSVSGNAGSATKLATARTINGVSFDGSANITVVDSTKAPLASPTFTGTPTAPTAAVNTNTTQVATTAFVNAEIANDAIPRIVSTDNAIVRFDGTTGLVQNSGVIIDDNGNVGINNNAPLQKLHVGGSIIAADPIASSISTFIGTILNNNSITPSLDIRRWNGSGTNHGVIKIAGNNLGEILFYRDVKSTNTDATTEKMKLDASGNLLVGTSVANGLDKVQIEGTFSSKAVKAFTGIDLNTLKTRTEVCSVTSTCTNLPIAETGFLEVFMFDSGSQWVMQRFTAIGFPSASNQGRTFVRNWMSANTWSAWVEK